MRAASPGGCVWVARIWRKWGLQPWRRESFNFSTDPVLEAKVRDVVGLYLAAASEGPMSTASPDT
jgi:hypothetical protein